VCILCISRIGPAGTAHEDSSLTLRSRSAAQTSAPPVHRRSSNDGLTVSGGHPLNTVFHNSLAVGPSRGLLGATAPVPDEAGAFSFSIHDRYRIQSLPLSIHHRYPIQSEGAPGEPPAADGHSPFDLAVIDVQMPEMDGLTLSAHILADSRINGCPILILTSPSRSEDIQRCQELGIRRYLFKPVKEADLLNSVQDILTPTEDHVIIAPDRKRHESPGGSLRVLLAEDGKINQTVAVRLLQLRGHAVTVANNGREAFEAYQQGDFDLILMDVQMPEMNGYEATRAIRKYETSLGTRVPIIAVTANAMKGDREKCLNADMDAYISKPIEADTLEALIQQVCGSPPLEQRAASGEWRE